MSLALRRIPLAGLTALALAPSWACTSGTPSDAPTDVDGAGGQGSGGHPSGSGAGGQTQSGGQSNDGGTTSTGAQPGTGAQLGTGGEGGGDGGEGPTLRFEPLPDGFRADALNPDGSLVLGCVSRSETEFAAAVYANGEVTELEPYDGDQDACARAANEDGSIVVGNSMLDVSDPEYPSAAVVWTDGGAAVRLPSPSASLHCIAWDASVDGRVIAGDCSTASSTEGVIVRWVDGVVESFDRPEGADSCHQTAISGDGQTIFGYCERAMVRWTEEDGLVTLPPPPTVAIPATSCAVRGASWDARRFVGDCSYYPADEAFRFTEGTGYEMMDESWWVIPDPSPIANAVSPADMSADGAFIVGKAQASNLVSAVRWDASGTPRLIRDLLEEAGTSVPFDWTLDSAWSISSDGSRMLVSKDYIDPANPARYAIVRLD